MRRLRSIVGWTLRGGDQTRAELALQADAIRSLQHSMAIQGDDGERLAADVRAVLADLTTRLGALSDRLDAIESVVADHDDLLGSLARIAAPPDRG